jgi:hypothetical protein
MRATEKEATRITRHLKIDDTLAAQTYCYTLADGKAYGGEAKVDGPGLAEMIRMFAEANVVPQKEPWPSFVFGLALKKLRSVKYVRAKNHRGS